jgi:hypothetical protein
MTSGSCGGSWFRSKGAMDWKEIRWWPAGGELMTSMAAMGGYI